MAQCIDCGTEVKQCRCWWVPDKCPCWFTEAEISNKIREQRAQTMVVKVKENQTRPVHIFEWLWKRDKCIYCWNAKFYCTDEICDKLISLSQEKTN